jgi:hypothetical protein
LVREAEKSIYEKQLEETPEFLGGLYNLVDWKPKRAEHEFFRVQSPRVGEMAPDFTLPSIDGGELTLSDLRGLPVVMELGSIT